MRGELVIVRSYGGRPLLRRVWDVGRNVVYITNDEQLGRLTQGLPASMPIGFPMEDVFAYDPEIAACIESLYQTGRLDWSSLKRWEAIRSSEESRMV